MERVKPPDQKRGPNSREKLTILLCLALGIMGSHVKPAFAGGVPSGFPEPPSPNPNAINLCDHEEVQEAIDKLPPRTTLPPEELFPNSTVEDTEKALKELPDSAIPKFSKNEQNKWIQIIFNLSEKDMSYLPIELNAIFAGLPYTATLINAPHVPVEAIIHKYGVDYTNTTLDQINAVFRVLDAKKVPFNQVMFVLPSKRPGGLFFSGMPSSFVTIGPERTYTIASAFEETLHQWADEALEGSGEPYAQEFNPESYQAFWPLFDAEVLTGKLNFDPKTREILKKMKPSERESLIKNAEQIGKCVDKETGLNRAIYRFPTAMVLPYTEKRRLSALEGQIGLRATRNAIGLRIP